MKVNFYTEAEIIGMDTTGLVTAYRELRDALEQRGIDTKVNASKDYDILHVHSFGFLSLYKILREKKPVAITTHTVPEEMSLLYRGGFLIEPLVRKYLEKFYGQADLLISPSEFARKRVNQMGVKKDPKVISNGIDPSKFQHDPQKKEEFLEEHGIDTEKTVVGCVGLPSSRKGLETFAEIARETPEKEFIWVGTNEYGRLLKDYRNLQKLERNPPENLTLTGFVEDIQGAYSSFDVFLFPTKIETEGLVVLEAASADVPIVCSDIEGLQWLEDGESCLKASEKEGYREKINELEENPELREKIIKGGKEIVEEKKFENIAGKIIDAYGSVTEEEK